ncbi:MAG: malate synthase G, partial [Candidatus Puniceispirillaceae bacterium]
GNLSVDAELLSFINDTLLPSAGVEADRFWAGFDEAVHRLAPRNAELLQIREEMQSKIDSWLVDHRDSPFDDAAYTDFLREIGYVVEDGEDFVIATENVDAEIARTAGPQLVVPVMNARYALNAANARWGSLYDALYGTDVISEQDGLEKGSRYNPARGAAVIAKARSLLDERAPLATGSWADITGLSIQDGQLVISQTTGQTQLSSPEQFAGYTGAADCPLSVLLKKNGLHIDIIIDADGQIGSTDAAGINDIVLESALSTIMDCEDSVAAVDGTDKILAYGNWLGLMTGTLSVEMNKGGKTFTR